jgi:hypothetical protein
MESPLGARELQEIEDRAARATSGPWRSAGIDNDGMTHIDSAEQLLISPGKSERTVDTPIGECWEEPDVAFIAHAREDIPRLVATVRSLQQPVTPCAGDCDEGYGPCAECRTLSQRNAQGEKLQ